MKLWAFGEDAHNEHFKLRLGEEQEGGTKCLSEKLPDTPCVSEREDDDFVLVDVKAFYKPLKYVGGF